MSKTNRKLQNGGQDLMRNSEESTLLAQLPKLLNGLKDGQYLVIDRDSVRLGVKQENGQLNLTKNFHIPVYKDADTQRFIKSTSIAQSPSKQPIKNFSQFGKEAKSAMKRRSKREQSDIKSQESLLQVALYFLEESKKVKKDKIQIGSHLYMVRTTDNGTQLYHEIYPKGHEFEFKPKTGEIKYIKFEGDEELTRLSLGSGMFQGKLTL